MPAPLFTFAAYLGAVTLPPPPNGVSGAAIALVELLLLGMLLVYGMLPFCDVLRTRPAAQAAAPSRQRDPSVVFPTRSGHIRPPHQ